MFLTTHASVAVAITASSSNPLLAFVVGWISHFLLDLIPHGDRGLNEWVEKGSRLKRITAAAAIDGCIAVLFFLAMILAFPLLDFRVAAAAALGSVLPDVLWGIAEIVPLPPLRWYQRKHHAFQDLVSDTLSLKAGGAVQLIFLLSSLLVLSLSAVS